MEDQSVTIELAREERVSCSPEIKAKLSVLDVAECALHVAFVGLKIPRPLSVGEMIAPAVVMYLHDLEAALGEPV
jgi:hypothetical protein